MRHQHALALSLLLLTPLSLSAQYAPNFYSGYPPAGGTAVAYPGWPAPYQPAPAQVVPAYPHPGYPHLQYTQQGPPTAPPQAYPPAVHQQQAPPQPAYLQPAYQQPAYQQPAYPQPAYQQPAEAHSARQAGPPRAPQVPSVAGQPLWGGRYPLATEAPRMAQDPAQVPSMRAAPLPPQSSGEPLPAFQQPGAMQAEPEYPMQAAPAAGSHTEAGLPSNYGAMAGAYVDSMLYGEGCNACGTGGCGWLGGMGGGIFGGNCGGNCGMGGAGCGQEVLPNGIATTVRSELSQWFASGGALVMRREGINNIALAVDTGTGQTVLNSSDADPGWQVGSEVRLGRRFGCWALEGVWWSLYEGSDDRTVFGANMAGDLTSMLDYGDLDLEENGLRANANLWFDDAMMQQTWRRFSVDNFELNLLHLPLMAPRMVATGGGFCSDGCCGDGGCAQCVPSPLSLSWAAGIRYLHLDETWGFNTDDENTNWDDMTGEIFHTIDLNNHLVGAQFGGHLFYQMSHRLSFSGDLKAGLFGNHIRQHHQVWGCQAGPALINSGPYVDDPFVVQSSTTQVSLLSELRLALNYQMSCSWRATGGYRILGITGVALPEDQVPFWHNNPPDTAQTRSAGSVLLHGFQFGIEYWH